jgi:hypothetical protein
VLLALPAAAQRVVDGDTIDLNGTRWTLRKAARPARTDGLQV